MGLFSDHPHLPRPSRLHLPVRLHSQFTMGHHMYRAARGVRSTALAASNDARIVGVVLVLAATALALEMAASFK